MEFKDEEELRTDVKMYIILHMIVFYRRIIESIIKLTVIRIYLFFFPYRYALPLWSQCQAYCCIKIPQTRRCLSTSSNLLHMSSVSQPTSNNLQMFLFNHLNLRIGLLSGINLNLYF